MPLNPGDWRFTVAPMLDWTDRHCRYFHRLLTSRARLYTEMVTTGAIIHGDRDRLLGFSPVSYTHLRAHETDSYLVCRLLLEKKTQTKDKKQNSETLQSTIPEK